VAGWVLDQILVMLHPFMPFITEELWSKMGPREHELIVAKWPMADARALDPDAAKEIDWLIRLVSEVRTARTELNVPPGARLPLHVRDASDESALADLMPVVRLARLARVDQATGEAGRLFASDRRRRGDLRAALGGVVDLEAERARLSQGDRCGGEGAGRARRPA
jgi:valyl-tRNA synthetase